VNELGLKNEIAGDAAATAKRRKVKCVVWDLDNTVWDGTLLEGDKVQLREGVREIIHALDARGILHSIASRNHAESALARLRDGELRARFGAAGRERARASYTVEHMARAYEQLWAQVCAVRRTPRLRPPAPRP